MERYIGETEHSLRTRFTQHRGYVNNNQTKRATVWHFNLPGGYNFRESKVQHWSIQETEREAFDFTIWHF